MEVKTDNNIHCPKCNSTSVEKLEAKENVHGIFGFYFRGSLEKEYKCKDCQHTW